MASAKPRTPSLLARLFGPLPSLLGARAEDGEADRLRAALGAAVEAAEASAREARKAEALLTDEKAVLESIASGAPLPDILAALCRRIEARLPGALCSVLLVEEGRVRHGAAPSLPEAYNRAIDGAAIGPKVGSCGTAAYAGKPVIVSDIAADPLWEDFRDLALSHGLRACWSTPVLDAAGAPAATFAVYYREPRSPSEADLAVADAAAHLASIAVARERSERSLRESEARLRTLIEHAPDAIVVFDADAGRFVDCNERACRLFGLPREALLRKGPIDVSPPTQPDGRPSAEAAPERIAATLAGEAQAFEWTHRTAAGQDVPCEIRLVRFPSASGRLLRGSIVDISERKRAEEARRRLEAQLQQIQRHESLGVLAGGIAHDFNNLLMGVLGNAELALADTPPDSPAVESLRGVEDAARRAAELAAQMLAYSGRGRFAVRPVDLSALVEESRRLVQGAVSRKAEVAYDLAPGLPPVEGDPTQMRQVLLNLARNASEAVGEGPGALTIRTGVVDFDPAGPGVAYAHEEAEAGRYAFLEIEDTGHGFEPETAARIFEPFFSTKRAGRGLGLAVVHGVVRGHKGAIEVRGAPGGGAAFRILLPFAEKQAEAAAPSGAREAPDAERRAGLVLLADDEDRAREVARRMLERAGFEVLPARDGRDALDKFRERASDFRAAVLDVTMPRMDGREARAAMLGLRPDLPVLLISGFDALDAAGDGRGEAGAIFLQKPFGAADLVAKLREVLGE